MFFLLSVKCLEVILIIIKWERRHNHNIQKAKNRTNGILLLRNLRNLRNHNLWAQNLQLALKNKFLDFILKQGIPFNFLKTLVLIKIAILTKQLKFIMFIRFKAFLQLVELTIFMLINSKRNGLLNSEL